MGTGPMVKTEDWFVLPRFASTARFIDPLVPAELHDDLMEAAAVLEVSPRMSAVLARRILADLLEDMQATKNMALQIASTLSTRMLRIPVTYGKISTAFAKWLILGRVRGADAAGVGAKASWDGAVQAAATSRARATNLMSVPGVSVARGPTSGITAKAAKAVLILGKRVVKQMVSFG